MVLLKRNFNPEIHHRSSLRLKGYDYSKPGYYFLTFCCYNKECLFGEIVEGQMKLNDFGRIADNEWIQSASIRAEIKLDEYIIMPNHVHAIIQIIENCHSRGDRPVAPTENLVATKGPKPKSVGSLMAGYKSSVTKIINEKRKKPGEKLWQRNFYEHIIKSETALQKIRFYIRNNPVNWSQDEFYNLM